jgi:hypothetical protein
MPPFLRDLHPGTILAQYDVISSWGGYVSTPPEVRREPTPEPMSRRRAGSLAADIRAALTSDWQRVNVLAAKLHASADDVRQMLRVMVSAGSVDVHHGKVGNRSRVYYRRRQG